MNWMVVLNFIDSSQKVSTNQQSHWKDQEWNQWNFSLLNAENLVNQEQYDRHMDCLSELSVLPKDCQVFFGEWVDHEHPSVKKVVKGLSIPPVFVENSRFHFGDFSNGGNDIFENHEIKTNVDVKDGRNESEEELNKMVFFETLLGAEGLKHFDHDDKVDYRTDERYQYFVEDVNRVDDESFIVVQDKMLEDDFWGDQVN